MNWSVATVLTMRRFLIGLAFFLTTALALTVVGAPAAQAHHEDKYTQSYVLKANPGLTVTQVQSNLYGFSFYTGAIDGSWGPKSRLGMADYVDNFRSVDTRPGVKRLQKIVGVTQDGRYGPATREAVRQWQRRHGLGADGIAGTQTRTRMGLPVCQCGGH